MTRCLATTVLVVAEHDVSVVSGLAVDGRPRVHTVLYVDVDGSAGGTRHVEHAEGGKQTPRRQQDVQQQQVVHDVDAVRGEEATHSAAVGLVRGVSLVVEAGVDAGGINPDSDNGEAI